MSAQTAGSAADLQINVVQGNLSHPKLEVPAGLPPDAVPLGDCFGQWAWHSKPVGDPLPDEVAERDHHCRECGIEGSAASAGNAFMTASNDSRELNQLHKEGDHPCHSYFCTLKGLYWARVNDESYRPQLTNDPTGGKAATKLRSMDRPPPRKGATADDDSQCLQFEGKGKGGGKPPKQMRQLYDVRFKRPDASPTNAYNYAQEKEKDRRRHLAQITRQGTVNGKGGGAPVNLWVAGHTHPQGAKRRTSCIPMPGADTTS